MAAENNNMQQSNRPGLRERRLSRVHFDGDDPPYTGAAAAVEPLNIRQGQRRSEGSIQEYFDASDRYAGGTGEDTRGRVVQPFEESNSASVSEERSRRSYAPPGQTPFERPNLDDLSPKSTTYVDNGEFRTAHLPAGYQLFPPNMPQNPQEGPYAAHVRQSPQLAPQAYAGSPRAVIAARLPFVPFEAAGSGHERRSSAPIAGMSGSPRNLHYPSPQRASVDNSSNRFGSPKDPYTSVPPRTATVGKSGLGMNSSTDDFGIAPSPTPAYSLYAPPNAQPLPPYQTKVAMPLKPALRRTQTEEEARKATRDAVDIVQHHTQGLRRRNVPGAGDGPTLESMPRNAGVLSNLLQLYGAPAGPKRTQSTESKWDGESTAMSRAASADSHFASREKFGRTDSVASFATTLYEEDLDPDDPRARKQEAQDKESQKPQVPGMRARQYSYADTDAASVVSKKSFKGILRRTKSFLIDEDAVYSDLVGKPPKALPSSKDKKRRLSITKHVADILQRHNFLLKLAKALMTYGSPSHRLESQLNATAQVLEVDAQFVHLPTVVIASFGDTDTHTSETHFVKAGGGLDLGKLHHVHKIYRQVVHDEASVQEGSAALSRLLKAPPIYKIWQRMLFAAICAGTIAPIGFGGSFVDAVGRLFIRS